MKTTLAPVQAGVGKPATQRACCFKVNPEARKTRVSGRRQVKCIVRRIGGKPAEGSESVVQRHPECTGDVIVASAGGAESIWCAGLVFVVRAAGQHTQCFERASYIRSVQAVVAVFALRECLEQTHLSQALQMNAGGGRGHLGDYGEFSARTRTPIRQRVKHACPRRLADRSRDSRRSITVRFRSHSLMVNEVWLAIKKQTVVVPRWEGDPNVSNNLILAVFGLFSLLLPLNSQAQWKTPWSYEGPRGPEHWGDLDPEYALCKQGKEQSPIDIQNTQEADLAPLKFEYRSEPLKYLINNGYTIRVNYHDAADSGNFLIIGDTRYQLTQFHFHRPSEEYIHGKAYDMEVHLMHKAADGKIIGVVVFLTSGKANAAIQQIWDHMPQTPGKEQGIPGVEINPAELLPQHTSYYQYEGSISAPPCNENVTWLVLKMPVEISREQISKFAKLYPHDVRPVQPLNGRPVKESR